MINFGVWKKQYFSWSFVRSSYRHRSRLLFSSTGKSTRFKSRSCTVSIRIIRWCIVTDSVTSPNSWSRSNRITRNPKLLLIRRTSNRPNSCFSSKILRWTRFKPAIQNQLLTREVDMPFITTTLLQGHFFIRPVVFLPIFFQLNPSWFHLLVSEHAVPARAVCVCFYMPLRGHFRWFRQVKTGKFPLYKAGRNSAILRPGDTSSGTILF